MNIILNGKKTEVGAHCSITELLEQLGLSGKPVVIEHNKVALFPRNYANTSLSESDQLEIINIAAGG